MIKNQLTMQEARKLFNYRDGMLYWRHVSSGHRSDSRAVTRSAKRVQINIGGIKYEARYVIWNWHHGVTKNSIVPKNGDVQDIRIENLREIEFISTRFTRKGIPCPCCDQPVPAPSAYVLAQNCGLTPMETRILEAVWAGKGRPVHTERIFDRMYEDDADGGPPATRMYATFKEKLSLLKRKLRGSGVNIENVGRKEGYRLTIKGDEKIVEPRNTANAGNTNRRNKNEGAPVQTELWDGLGW